MAKMKGYRKWLQEWRCKEQIRAHGLGVLFWTNEQIDNPKLGDSKNGETTIYVSTPALSSKD